MIETKKTILVELENDLQGLSTYSVYYSFNEIEFSGEVKFYNDGRNQSPYFEPLEFSDKNSRLFYEENWEQIELEIFDRLP
ncbi:MAG: hypothetical protein RLZZ86_285 [Cyanobacteriota bacterium]|jgi:hypothetical protein